MNDPFFIVGSVRSGTTLLRDLFKEHPDYDCPEETFVYRWSWPFGSKQFIHPYLNSELFKKHQKLDGISTDQVADLMSGSKTRAEFLEKYCETHKRARGSKAGGWFEKTPQHVYGLMLAGAEIPSLRFLNIIRNPLNVVASLKKGLVMKEESIVGASNYWREAVILFDEFTRLHPDRCRTLFYEDLCSSPLETLTAICEFLGISNPFHKVKLSHVRAERNQYQTELTETEQALVREICEPLIGKYQLPNYFEQTPRIETAAPPVTETEPVQSHSIYSLAFSNGEEPVREDLGLGLKPGAGHYRTFDGSPEEYDELAAMTFNLLTVFGLRQHHRLLEIGCGSLNSGRLLIPYLNQKNYVGAEPEEWLVQAGISRELGMDLIRIKQPGFLIADQLTDLPADEKFDFGLAQSIFSRCSPDATRNWLKQMEPRLKPGGACFAAFPPGKIGGNLKRIAKEAGFKYRLLDWDHPRQKWVILFKPDFPIQRFWGCEPTWNNRIK